MFLFIPSRQNAIELSKIIHFGGTIEGTVISGKYMFHVTNTVSGKMRLNVDAYLIQLSEKSLAV